MAQGETYTIEIDFSAVIEAVQAATLAIQKLEEAIGEAGDNATFENV